VISEDKRKVLEIFVEGRRAYKLMRFVEARDAFAKALKIDPRDGPSQKYHDRCQDLIENPPPEDWDGVYVMKTK